MFRLIVAPAIACSCGAALAQKEMYRCGNQYRDRPCEGLRMDAARSSAANPDSQQKQQTAGKRQEREQAIYQAKCENYAEEPGDTNRRIKGGRPSHCSST